MNYTKWLIYTCALLTFAVAMQKNYEVFTELLDLDQFTLNTYICFSSIAVFFTGVVYSGFSASYNSTNKDVLDRQGFLCTCLGLLGTFIGLFQLFESTLTVDTTSLENIKVLMMEVVGGLGLAFKTTIVGLICSICLSGYSLILGDKNE